MTYTMTLAAGMDYLNANHRTHWAAKAKRTRYWRDRARLEARRAGIPALDRAHITVTIHKTRGGRYDPGNLAPTAKAIVDGLVDAGVLDDDDATRVIGPDMRAGEKRDVRQLVITIEALPEEKTA
ncbi:hypothetical protein ACI3EY_16715 [Ornithinimicrobium sp. LYQ92]|uniref:hypothetical protein n=1 Tax=Serinicoccus sp. LYQ92 TaxID=3378798 RepID=UPI003854E866